MYGKGITIVHCTDKGSKLIFYPQYLSYYSTKPYVVGTQKKHLTETILLSTHNIGFECQIRILEHEIFALSRAVIAALNRI